MSASVDIRHNIKDVIKSLNSFQKKQIPFATSQALNDTAFDVRKVEQEQLSRYIDQPTPFTKRGIRVKKTNKRELRALVYFDDKVAQYMQYQIKGGTRRPNNKKILIPTDNMRRNKYGNITKGARDKLFTNNKNYSTPTGIFQRYGSGAKSRRLLARFVDKAEYTPRLPFKTIAIKAANDKFRKNFDKRIAKAIKSAK